MFGNVKIVLEQISTTRNLDLKIFTNHSITGQPIFDFDLEEAIKMIAIYE